MVADEVDAPPVSIVGVELRRVPVRQRPELQKFGRPGAGPEGLQRIAGPAGALALDRLLQRNVGPVEVRVDEFDWLVDDLVCDGAIGVEGRAEIVLSVGKGVHGDILLSAEATLAESLREGRDAPPGAGRFP